MAENYSTYVENLRIGLKAGCGKDKTDIILAEATAHLEEGIEELFERGMSRGAAEEAVMARFGDANAVCKWYADQHRRPSVWRASRWPLAMMFLSLAFWGCQNEILPFSWVIHHASLIVMNSLLLITAALCYRCQRFISGVVVFLAACLFGVLVGSYCIWYVPIQWVHSEGVVPRSSISKEIREAQTRLASAEANYALFSKGKTVFEPAREPAAGVGQFHNKQGYLTPIYFQTRDPHVHVYFDDVEVFGIFASYKEARNFWEKQPSRRSDLTGKTEIHYLAGYSDEIAQDQRIIRDLPHADSTPFTERLVASVASAKYPAMFLLGFGLIADITGGVLRTLVDLLRRRRRHPSGPITS